MMREHTEITVNRVIQTCHWQFDGRNMLRNNKLDFTIGGILLAFSKFRKILNKLGEYDMKKEILFGALWGMTIGLILVAILFSTASSAEILSGGGNIDISISGDSVTIDIDKGDIEKTIIVSGDSLQETSSGINVENELIIEDGKIFIDGVELTEEELTRLSINQDQETSTGRHKFDSHRQIKRKRLATAYMNSGDLVKFNDISIDSSMSIKGDVISISGDITISGEVLGDVVSVFGDVNLDDGAYVRGDVSAPFGEVHRSQGVEIRGETIWSKDRGKRHKREVETGLSARFNRVEGFTFLPTMEFEDMRGKLPALNLAGAYAVTLKRWEYDFGIKHRIGNAFGPSLSFNMYQWAKTPDLWRFSETENTIAGLFFKEDFHDFYWARGFSGSAGLFYGEKFTGGVGYTAYRISNLKRTAKTTILGGDKKLRENWSTILPDSTLLLASTGDLREISVNATYDSRDDKVEPRKGHLVHINWARSLEASSDNFDYEIVTADLRSIIPLSPNQTIYLRGRGGYSDDELPLHNRFFLGGVGSLRGFDYKEFQGNRSILVSGYYIWTFYRSDFGAGVFFDAGKAADGGDAFDSMPLKGDVGLSLIIEDSFRLDLAQRLDDLDKSPVVMARLQISM